ncbi:MAG TPA: hypothetical protein VFK07_02415 [Candidatus Paceibacterota bacterium]|nr:hypothetical protein [Candidatus Paceibacterota bacterium]
MKTLIIIIAILVLLAGGYIAYQHYQPNLAVSVTESPTASASGFCYLRASAPVTAYDRPSTDAAVFGTVSPEETNAVVTAQTDNGWLGFEPGVAQAPNVGPFRLRYVQDGGAFTLEGNCGDLPTVAALPANTCFAMADNDMPVHASPANSSSLILTMHYGDYAATIGKKGSGTTAWLKLDGTQASIASGSFQTGWIQQSLVNFNGPSCSNLPPVSQ